MTSDAVADWIQSGVVALTGTPGGPALIPPGSGASFARACTRFLHRVSGTEATAALDGGALLAERAAFGQRAGRRGRVSVGGHTRLLPCADGWVALSCAREDDPALIGAMIGESVEDDPWPRASAWLAANSGAHATERMDLLGLAGGHVTFPIPRARAALPALGRSVQGALVVDFSALWAGPLCAHLLGSAGAQVIKVETPQRPDGARRGITDFYDLLHHGHRSVVLDPEDPAQRARLHALVSAADIVIESSRPRALRRFGIRAEEFVAAGATWLSITAHGRASNRIGFGDDVAATAGAVALDHEGLPVFVGDAIADPLTGLYAAVCALDRDNDAHGRLWDISMTDVVASTLDGACPTHMPAAEPPSAPRPRPVVGAAPAFGVDTDAVVAQFCLGSRRPREGGRC